MKNGSHILLKSKTAIPFKFSNKNSLQSRQIPLDQRPQISFSDVKTETYFISLIHSSKFIVQLKQIHCQVIRQHFFSNSRISSLLISSSSLHKCSSYSLRIFRSFDNPNVFVFNAFIRGLTDNSCYKEAIEFFRLMLKRDVKPSEYSFPFVLKSVGKLGIKQVGKMLHCGILKTGFEFDCFVRVSLVDMYVKAELISHALQLFDESPEVNKQQSVLLWNVVINGCCKDGILVKAMELFDKMPERNLGSWNIIVDGLMRNGHAEKAMELFERMVEKDVVTWTTAVHGLFLNGMYEKALQIFFKMVEERNRPNDLTLVSALSACAKIGAVKSGMTIHEFILNNGFQLNAAVGTALIDMYAKCGEIQSARQVFDNMKVKDILTWTTMISGLAIHGFVNEALECFETMKSHGIEPDEVAFLAILTACTHAGRVNQGLQFFNSMKLDYSIEPKMKHYALIVDLYGRAGQLNEALTFIQTMPMEPDSVIWGTLFSACRAHKNIELAKYVSEKLLRHQPKHPGSYVFMSNIYGEMGRWEDAEKVRTLMKHKGTEKDPGWSYN